MFNKKSKKIEKLLKALTKTIKEKRDLVEDFILILEDIQNTNNEKLQWKHKQLVINNKVDLAIENYKKKIVSIDIDPQY